MLISELVVATSACLLGYFYNQRKIKEAEINKPNVCDHQWEITENFTSKSFNDILPNYRVKIIYKTCKKCGESDKIVYRDRI